MSYFNRWKSLGPWAKATSGFLTTLSLLIILTLFGGMQLPLVLAALLPLLVGLVCALQDLFHSRSSWTLGLLGFLIFVSSFNLAQESLSIFGGRDQGSIAEAAWQLAQHGELAYQSSLSQAFFTVYGPGTALNFPGFAYTALGSLMTQFPLGYIAWLAAFVGPLGLFGYALANSILFVFSGWTFFECASHWFRRPIALTGTVLFTATFFPVWILHYTLSEHLALVLFLVLAHALTLLYQNFDPWKFGLVWWSAALFLFTRIEGLVLFPLAIGLMLFSQPAREFVLAAPLRRFLLPLLITGFLFLRDFFINLPFYTVIAKAVLKNWYALTAPAALAETADPTTSLLSISLAYGLLPLFILGCLGLATALITRQKQFLDFILLTLPTGIYLIDGHITPDHPWMLRRYYFSLWPFFIFFTLFFWHFLENRLPRFRTHLFVGMLALFLLVEAPASRLAWQMDEFTPLLRSLTPLAETLGERDLLLVDRLASGDPFRLLSSPLHFSFGKQAVYFFNPEDLSRVSLDGYSRILLLVPEADTALWERRFAGHIKVERTFSFPLITVRANHALLPTSSVTTSTAALLQWLP